MKCFENEEFDSKYNIDSEIVKEEILMAEERNSEEHKVYEQCLEDLESVDSMLGKMDSAINGGSEQEIRDVAMEARTLINELSGAYKVTSSGSKFSMESLRLQPFTVLSYAKEDITDIVKTIIFKLKQFLLYIARTLRNVLEKIYWYAIDLPGDAKKLLEKMDEQNLGSKDYINDSYGSKLIEWMNVNYPSLSFISSMAVAKNPGPAGLGKTIMTMSESEVIIDIPELTDLSIGSAEKFSNEMMNFYRTSSIDVGRLFFKNIDIIKSNILTIEGVDLNKYKDVDVFVYNVDPKFVYYIVMTINNDNYLRTLMGKVRLETFRAPQIRSVTFTPGDVNTIMRGSPTQYIQVLLDEIISGCPKTQKLITRVPGKIKEVEGMLRDNINLYDSKRSQGDIVKNLKVYSGFVKNLFRSYYRDIMVSKMTTYLFYYKFSSVVYGSLLGSKQS